MAGNVDSQLSPLKRFGRELARCRKEVGWSQRRLSDRIGCSPSLVGHIEVGSRNPQLDFSMACDRLFGLSDENHFVRLYRRIHQSSSGPGWFLRWLEEIEPGATVLRIWAPFLVPGLLQTEDYARAVFLGRFSTPEAEVEEQVASRMQRQEILNRDNPPEMRVLLDEWVLNRPIGDKKVMYEQLSHLLAVAKRRHVTVQLVPYDTACTDGLSSAFVIAELTDAPTTVSVDSAGKGEVSEENDLVTQILDRYDRLSTEAYRPGESLEKIKEAVERWNSRI
ncbi:Scr1 family TA system antitoxin-like transcriptional regulator [Streptosporangium sp. NPDC000509]|uniref:helix-turn-helix domain-containing protein n=1 Tax=Streptosporangium sp. NPDC000509 TaxID=3366186 RepID=UPI00369C55FE